MTTDIALSGDARLDEALRETFPASDAVAVGRVPLASDNKRGAHIANLNRLLSELFALYIATKGCHWHVSGPHFRDYHLLLDEQAQQILATTDPVAERVRKLGAQTITSLWDAGLHAQRSCPGIAPAPEMIGWLLEANKTLAELMREAHALSSDVGDIATTSLLETWIDEAEGRVWFLFEATRREN